MARILETKEQIERQLRLGIVPETDNRSLLCDMGFQPLYPHVQDGYHENLWGRQVETTASGSGRRRAVQRAYLNVKPVPEAA
jgi:hypothetical protein